MILVVDSNVLFTFFWKNSVLHELIGKITLFAPEYAQTEIQKYSEEICNKTKITRSEFRQLLVELKSFVKFVPQKYYELLIKKIVSELPAEKHDEFLLDIDFLALAYHIGCALWSNDALLKEQSIVQVVSTKDVISLI